MKRILIVILSFLLITNIIYAQKTFDPMVQTKHVIWGHGYDVNSFSRFLLDTKNTIPSPVWNQSIRSSGLHVRFITNASSITVNYTLSSESKGNKWFGPVGANGLDMYARKPNGEWSWCHPNPLSIGEVFTYEKLNPNDPIYNNEGYEYWLYFPLFGVTTSLSITVNSDANFEFIPVTKEYKPIVVYGTSVVHGAVCSRPGNSWTSIVGRSFPERSIINLGFSGAGKVEPEVIDVINEIDADLYIIDCLPNYSNPSMPLLVNERYKSAINKLLKNHADAAILLTEHFGYSDMDMNEARRTLVELNNIELKKVYAYFIEKGYKNIFYLSREDLSLDMSADIADYVHPNDKGMYRFAEVYISKINEILSRNISRDLYSVVSSFYNPI